MLLPNEALAVAVATEWDSQRDVIQQQNMHIVNKIHSNKLLSFVIFISFNLPLN